MGYALGGGNRRGGLIWLLASAGLALALSHLSSFRPLPARAPVMAEVVSGERSVRLTYRDADGRWRLRGGLARGAWASAPAAAWRQDMPGFSVRLTSTQVDLRERPRTSQDPYYLAIAQGRVDVFAGRPRGYHLLVATTPLLAGTLGPAEVARLRRTLRVSSVAAAWQALSALGG